MAHGVIHALQTLVTAIRQLGGLCDRRPDLSHRDQEFLSGGPYLARSRRDFARGSAEGHYRGLLIPSGGRDASRDATELLAGLLNLPEQHTEAVDHGAQRAQQYTGFVRTRRLKAQGEIARCEPASGGRREHHRAGN